jgi:hypothetical protein
MKSKILTSCIVVLVLFICYLLWPVRKMQVVTNNELTVKEFLYLDRGINVPSNDANNIVYSYIVFLPDLPPAEWINMAKWDDTKVLTFVESGEVFSFLLKNPKGIKT